MSKPLDVRLLLEKGSIEGPFRRRTWWRLLLEFLMADRPDLSINHKEIL